jgi:hypothetical protein
MLRHMSGQGQEIIIVVVYSACPKSCPNSLTVPDKLALPSPVKRLLFVATDTTSVTAIVIILSIVMANSFVRLEVIRFVITAEAETQCS